MSKFVQIAAAFAVVAASTLALTASLPAQAREGNSSSSVGHGIKCRTVAVKQADGTIVYQQVCRKGV